jgi:ubiquinone/menaquinone biosynthesis C-methylase UbiE
MLPCEFEEGQIIYVKDGLYSVAVLPDSTLLEFGVGQGGDFFRWKRTRVGKVVGIDPATRGLKEAEMKQVAVWIKAVIESKGSEASLKSIRNQVLELCRKFPVYGDHHAV